MSYAKRTYANTGETVTYEDFNRIETGIANNDEVISGIKSNIADAYDSAKTYAVGDMRINNNTLYICTTAIATAEAFNTDHWEETTLAQQINVLSAREILDLPFASGLSSTGTNKIVKCNKKITLYISLNKDTTIGFADVIATLPVGYRPMYGFNVACRGNNGEWTTALITILTDGNIYCACTGFTEIQAFISDFDLA